MKRYKKPTVYASSFDAHNTALNLSYKFGEEFFVCEIIDKPGYVIKSETTVYSETFDKRSFKSVKGTRIMGWGRGLHKELGDDSPCKIMFKVEVDRTKYTW